MEPLWFYCWQTGHCSKGIVFTINLQKEGHTFKAFKEKALAMASIKLTGEVHDLTAGKNGGLAYPPPHVDAKPGDEIRFAFISKNHTITQSSFDKLCSHLEYGFDTGFEFIRTSKKFITKSFFIPNTKDPLWFYCQQKVPFLYYAKGMVFTINMPKEGNTFKESKEKTLPGIDETVGPLNWKGVLQDMLSSACY